MAGNCSRFLGAQIEQVGVAQRKPKAFIRSTEHHLIGHCIEDAHVAKNTFVRAPSDRYHVSVDERTASAFLREARIPCDENSFLLRDDLVSYEAPNYIEIGPQEKSRVFPDGIGQIVERDLGDRTPNDRIEDIG